jgi:hypothetical protein
VKCPVCQSRMSRYENPARWVCTNIKAHDAASVRLRLPGSTKRGARRGTYKRKKKT